MNNSENARYREAAEYTTTVEAAIKAIGVVTSNDCLDYALRHHLQVRPYVYADETSRYSQELTDTHPDYVRLLTEYQEKTEQDLHQSYDKILEKLRSDWEADRAKKPLDGRMLLADRLKKSAQRIKGHAGFFYDVCTGETQRFAQPHHAMLYGARDNANVAAELTHFQSLLAEFHKYEQGIKAKSALTTITTSKVSPTQIQFSDYLKEECRDKLLPFLKEKYTNSKPKVITAVLFALSDLGLLAISLNGNQTELHAALKYFGNVGTLQALNASITGFNQANNRQRNEIERHKTAIHAFMKLT